LWQRLFLSGSEGGIRGRGRIGGEQAAARKLTQRVVLHVESNGPSGLGATADVIELEAHERFNEGALAVGLVADNQHRRSLEWGVKLLGQTVQLVVRLVQPPLLLRLRFPHLVSKRAARAVGALRLHIFKIELR